MEEIGPLLAQRSQEGTDQLSPNLRPRHQDLLPTPCGPMKRWSELSVWVRIYFVLTVASLLVLFGLTVPTYEQRTDPDLYNQDFAVSIIQLIGILFCIYYISRGVLQENRQELVVFVFSLLVVMGRSLINFCVVGPEGKEELLARFVCIMVLGSVHVVCTVLLLRTPNMMAFRVGGALESLQEQYFLSNLCFSMVTFDLQAQLCLCVLITITEKGVLDVDRIILGVGVLWALLTAAVGAVAVLKEIKCLVWIFLVQNLPQVAFVAYLMYRVVEKWFSDRTYTHEAAAVTGALLSVLIKAVLLWALVKRVPSFGQGLRERMFESAK